MKRMLQALLLGTALATTPGLADHASHSAAEVQAGELAISGAFLRATLPRAPVGGGYLTIANQGTEDDRLVSVTAPVGKEVQIHEMANTDGVMTMRQLVGGLPIPAGRTVVLEPGGLHLMVMGLTERLVEGKSMDMVLRFEKAGEVTVRFDILALNTRGMAEDHTGHAAPAGDREGHGMSHDGAGFDQARVEGDEARITGLLKDMFETENAPLSVAPILIEGDTAVIGWSQEDRGGRALLRRDAQGFWRVSLCAGDGLKGEANMAALGVEPEAATRLAAIQAQEEAALPPEQVARFASFDGVMHVDQEGGH
ncbi:copper uptake system-associated protein [uncultured Paracoccus sp.]|uniref:copper uptake system-associated protein n=1 Tax=uncultured Paracoccus sp. TaxID=189685 RepID=UPI0025ED0A27|nr:copper uptake system-associated protein [uncultured Paracoccus sp.]